MFAKSDAYVLRAAGLDALVRHRRLGARGWVCVGRRHTMCSRGCWGLLRVYLYVPQKCYMSLWG